MTPPNSTRKLRVVLTNDDGPPGPDSPYMINWYLHLTKDLGWDVKVVIPSTQKSWISQAWEINNVVEGRYYYPKESGEGEITPLPRSLKEGEIGEWILLDGTPATCANIALKNLFPGEIDLLISGPNFGRNASNAFTMCSGTVGAALAASLTGTRGIALSYGNMVEKNYPTYYEPAHKLSLKIINYLLDNWNPRGTMVLYSVNIPMVKELLQEDGLKIYWASAWMSNYLRLFAEVPSSADSNVADADGKGSLAFKFDPDLSNLLSPTGGPEGSDAWAMNTGSVGVTPYINNLAELPESENSFASLQDREWKF